MDTTSLEKSLGDAFSKLPSLPLGVKQFIVQVAPWLAVIGALMAAVSLPALLGIGLFLVPFGSSGALWTIILIIPALILNVMAIPGLFSRSYQGWKYMFWSVLVNGLLNLVTLNFAGLIIGLGISLYLLFQVREFYTTMPVSPTIN